MTKWRKRPVLVDAFRWTGDVDQEEDPEWMVIALRDGRARFEDSGSEHVRIVIQTTEGDMTAQSGDYIIRGIKGELYPCKPDIFEATYECVGYGER
jgi:hypothetical protein